MISAHAEATAFLLAFCIGVEAARELCFKKAADGVDIRTALRKPLTFCGVGLWIVELIAWVRVLETVPLSIAFPLMALVYVVIVLGGTVILHEKVTMRHALGAVLIAAGAGCIGVTGL